MIVFKCEDKPHAVPLEEDVEKLADVVRLYRCTKRLQHGYCKVGMNGKGPLNVQTPSGRRFEVKPSGELMLLKDIDPELIVQHKHRDDEYEELPKRKRRDSPIRGQIVDREPKDVGPLIQIMNYRGETVMVSEREYSVIIACENCGGERRIKKQDKFQVKCCVPCTRKLRRRRKNERKKEKARAGAEAAKRLRAAGANKVWDKGRHKSLRHSGRM